MLNKYGKIGSIVIFIIVAFACAIAIGKCSRESNKEAKEYEIRKETVRQDSIKLEALKNRGVSDASCAEFYEKIIEEKTNKLQKVDEIIENITHEQLTYDELRREIAELHQAAIGIGDTLVAGSGENSNKTKR